MAEAAGSNPAGTTDTPVAQRQRHLPDVEAIAGSSPAGSTRLFRVFSHSAARDCTNSPSGLSAVCCCRPVRPLAAPCCNGFFTPFAALFPGLGKFVSVVFKLWFVGINRELANQAQ